MKTVCIDGPLRGQVIQADDIYFRYVIPVPESIFGFHISNEPTPNLPEIKNYSLKSIPATKFSPYLINGGPDLNKMDIGTWSDIRLIQNKAYFDVMKDAYKVWSIK